MSQWLPALDGIVEQLEAGIAGADIGCGHGHSTTLMAQAFPHSHFYGFDAHSASIGEAKQNAAAAGVAERVNFEVARAVDYPDKQYGLICFFDCLHDMGDPVAAARYTARMLAPGGTVMLVEPFAQDRVEQNLSLVSRMYYAASTTICCAHAISEGVSSRSAPKPAKHVWPRYFARQVSLIYGARLKHLLTSFSKCAANELEG